MLMHLLLLVILFHQTVVGEKMASCRLTFGSNQYDLARLSDFTLNGDGTTPDRYHYAMNPCGVVPATACGLPQIPRAGVMACQSSSSNTFISILAFIDGFKETNASFVEREESGSGVVMTLQNGDGCGGPPRSMIVTFICDPTVKQPTSIDVDETPSCRFNIKLRAADACPSGSSHDSTSTPFGAGAIFVVVLVVIVIVYLVVGLSWNRFRKDYHGLELIPHRHFWTNIFALFVGGFRFISSKVRPGSNSQYQNV